MPLIPIPTEDLILIASERRSMPADADGDEWIDRLRRATPTRIRTERPDGTRSTFAVFIGYDPAERVVEAKTTGGELLRYLDVPPSIWQAMVRAKEYGSLGKFWQQVIFGKFFGLPVAREKR